MWEHEFQDKVLHELREILKEIKLQRDFLQVVLTQPKSIDVKWSINGMATNAVNLNLDVTANAVGIVTELNNDGSVFKFDPTKIQVAVQDINVVTATVDTTSGNIIVKPVAVGITQVVVQDSATNIASPNYTFTVVQVGPSPTSLSVSWTVTP